MRDKKMRIIIIGDGKVGYKLAKQLSAEKYDIIMIDSNENKLRFAMDRLDIACVTGDGADAEVLKQADVAHAEVQDIRLPVCVIRFIIVRSDF